MRQERNSVGGLALDASVAVSRDSGYTIPEETENLATFGQVCLALSEGKQLFKRKKKGREGRNIKKL